MRRPASSETLVLFARSLPAPSEDVVYDRRQRHVHAAPQRCAGQCWIRRACKIVADCEAGRAADAITVLNCEVRGFGGWNPSRLDDLRFNAEVVARAEALIRAQPD